MARDLDHLSAEELSGRIADCINNMRIRTENDKLGLSPVDQPHGHTWMVLFTEIMEECELRGYSFPGPINISGYGEFLDHAFDPIPDVLPAFMEFDLTSRPYMLKYSEERWLKPALERGQFQIGSAYYYDSNKHNHARRDKELRRCFKRHPNSDWEWLDSPTDYHIFSLCGAYASRQFGDFHADACLVIHEPHELIDRLLRSTEPVLPGWRIFFKEVSYYDPVRVDPGIIDVPTCKPFKHAYQAEKRLICIPPSHISALSPMNIEIGPIFDIAELVTLNSRPRLAPKH